MTIKIGIIGSRSRTSTEDWVKVLTAFNELYHAKQFKIGEIRIISGGCPWGADNWAEHISRDNGIPITIHYADWKALGKKAGPIRNKLIAQDSDILIAAPDEGSKGTVDCINKFKKLKPTAELILV